jgi:AcrR family transcriptional regulator
MNARGYHSPLRGAQAAATSERILAAVGTLLEKGEEPTFALVASEAGCEQRTVYRHFPNKDELAAAFWTWQARLLGPEEGEPSTEDELLGRVATAFAGFDAHERHIRAMLHTEHGRDARLSDNARRQATFLRVLDDAVPGLDPARRLRAAASLQLLLSAASWESLRDYWGLEGDEAVAAVQQAIAAMLEGLRRQVP